jgi:hypothetical protein
MLLNTSNIFPYQSSDNPNRNIQPRGRYIFPPVESIHPILSKRKLYSLRTVNVRNIVVTGENAIILRHMSSQPYLELHSQDQKRGASVYLST